MKEKYSMNSGQLLNDIVKVAIVFLLKGFKTRETSSLEAMSIDLTFWIN